MYSKIAIGSVIADSHTEISLRCGRHGSGLLPPACPSNRLNDSECPDRVRRETFGGIMPGAELNLTEQERIALHEISQRTGKSENELIREAVEQLIARFQSNALPALLLKGRGIWKYRKGLPTLAELRSEWQRS
jgi:hypothetical protein